MGDNSLIHWCNATWNPLVGCSVVSPGCTNCYAMREAGGRLRNVPKFVGLTEPSKAGPVWNGQVRLWEAALEQPLRWKKPRMIFVNSMSDLFHKAVPRDHIAKVFDTMEQANWHIYQVLTKRSTLLMKFLNERYKERPPPSHIWFGVSVEDGQATSRIAHL